MQVSVMLVRLCVGSGAWACGTGGSPSMQLLVVEVVPVRSVSLKSGERNPFFHDQNPDFG